MYASQPNLGELVGVVAEALGVDKGVRPQQLVIDDGVAVVLELQRRHRLAGGRGAGLARAQARPIQSRIHLCNLYCSAGAGPQ